MALYKLERIVKKGLAFELSKKKRKEKVNREQKGVGNCFGKKKGRRVAF